MRRKLYYLTAGLAAALLLTVACSSDDPAEKPVPEPATLTAPALTLSADAVRIDPEHSDQLALHAEWTAATDDEQTEVAYTLYVNLTDRDMFSDPVIIDKGTALTHDFTHGELNQLLLNTFDLEAGTEVPVRFAVYAKNADEEFDAQLSEIRSCEITPKTTYPNFPPSLIMVGAATPWQWDLNAGLELPESSEGSRLYLASDVELHVQPMSLNNGFKFYFSRNINDTDDPRFAAQDLSAETFGKIAVYKSGEAQFQPGSFGYENGMYDIEVNLNTKMLTLTRTGDLPETPFPEQLYLLGDCFTWGWTWDGTQLTKAEEGIYRGQNIDMTFGDNGDVGFKMFTERDNWGVYYAMTDDATADDISLQLVTDTDAPQVYPGKLGYGKGVYDIEVNLNTMKMTLTSKSIDYSTAYSMTGEATPGGWDSRTYLPKKGDNEWEATGIAMNFDGDYKGFKIFASSDGWWPWYGQTPDAPFGTVIRIEDQAASDAKGDPQFYPSRFGYTSGTYTINLNLNTMTLTLTKEN